jgi:hypothetical protein
VNDVSKQIQSAYNIDRDHMHVQTGIEEERGRDKEGRRTRKGEIKGKKG